MNSPHDVIMDSIIEVELEPKEKELVDEDHEPDQEESLLVPNGPMTRSKTKKLKEAVGGILIQAYALPLYLVQEGKEVISNILVVIQVQEG